MVNNGIKNTSLIIVRIAMISALLTASKFALSFIPNVEIITLLIMVFSASFGMVYILPATLVFCATEILIYGIQSWVILYFICWPMLAIISSLILRKKKLVLALIVAIGFSLLFGLISACSDTLFCLGYLSKSEIGKYFLAYYLRGITFDLIHTISNFVLVLILFKPLVSISRKIMPKVYCSNHIGSLKMFNKDYVYIREDRNDN